MIALNDKIGTPRILQEIVISEVYQRQEIEVANSISTQLPEYEGEYCVTPSAEGNITLGTSDKVLRDDITVKKIPYAEVSNSKGGITATIGN